MRVPLLVHVAILASVLAGCGDPTEPALTPPPELILAPGLLMNGPPPLESLVTNEIVPQGVPFLVKATSFGSSSCTEEAGYQSVASSTRVEIRLFDRVAPDGYACTRDVRAFTRTLIVEFDRAGTAEVVVLGRDGDGNPLEIRRSVTVEENH